jgi:hypothetical protein
VLLLILYQLDLVSLCRLKCVSKLWNEKIPDIVFKRFVKSSFLVRDSFLATLKNKSETADWLREWDHLDSSTHFRSVQSGKPDTQCVTLSQHFVFLGAQSVEKRIPGIFFLPLEGKEKRIDFWFLTHPLADVRKENQIREFSYMYPKSLYASWDEGDVKWLDFDHDTSLLAAACEGQIQNRPHAKIVMSHIDETDPTAPVVSKCAEFEYKNAHAAYAASTDQHGGVSMVKFFAKNQILASAIGAGAPGVTLFDYTQSGKIVRTFEHRKEPGVEVTEQGIYGRRDMVRFFSFLSCFSF